MGRLGLAFRCFFRVLGGKSVPDELLPTNEEPLALPAGSPTLEEQAQALQLLGVLQKEGRLLDFLQEDIESYQDGQIGAAVRSIHRDCRRALADFVGLAPVLDGREDDSVTVEPGFDPSRIRLIGNVTGEPPFTGVLRHRGWQATQVTLSRPPQGHDKSVISPAEVELP